jgi:hypothetical protein
VSASGDALCALCKRGPGTVKALAPDDEGDPQPVLVCAECYARETSEARP